MTILGIDTSFDDTAAAVVMDDIILSNVLSSDLSVYQEWGGVVPRLARLSHQKHIDSTVQTALKRARIAMDQIDAIAVTQGPGLSITLEIGITKAKELAIQHKKPLVAVNHMEGHLLSCFAQPNTNTTNSTAIVFPAIGILVSGKNTQFVLVKAIGDYTVLGQTQDDAMGEAFDKVGRMLGLGYPAGALIEKLAKKGIPNKIIFPIPMRSIKSADTSYSGLKTAAMRIIDPLKEARGGMLTKQDICDVALGFQTACITHLTEKLLFAIKEEKPKSLMLGGGVGANTRLRARLRSISREYAIPLYLPYTKKLYVDNAAMIALVGVVKAKRGFFVKEIETLDRQPNMRL